MIINYLPSAFPAKDATDGQFLYRSLGSFWTQLFQDKQALHGYTLGMAEELIQTQINLAEVVRQYAVKDIDVFHKEKWKALIIKKSEFNKAPFVFEEDSAVFGLQPDTDSFYANQIFRFGYSKQTDNKTAFSFTPAFDLVQASAVANRLVSPSLVLIPGVDFVIQAGTLYFNTNIFENEYIPRTKILGELGVPSTYLDSFGNTIADEMIILWVYQASVDSAELYNNFGSLLALNLPSSESYKELLKNIINLSVEGPTIKAINLALSALLNVPTIIESSERVEDIYSDDNYQYVVTDKNIYRIAPQQRLNQSVLVGNALPVGTQITTSVQVIDSLMDPVWWKNVLPNKKLVLAGHIFAISATSQLIFEDKPLTITYTNGILRFPVIGRDNDVAAFNSYLNRPDKLPELLSKLTMSVNEDSALTVNPVDFLFANVFRNNVLFIKLDFYTSAQMVRFFELFSVLQRYLPPHIYIVLYLALQQSAEELKGLNTGQLLSEYIGQSFGCDGSNALTGSRPGTIAPITAAATDPNYYKDVKNRLFGISVGPYKNNRPLHEALNIDTLQVNNHATAGGVQAGRLRTYIPANATTKEVPSILLIDF